MKTPTAIIILIASFIGASVAEFDSFIDTTTIIPKPARRNSKTSKTTDATPTVASTSTTTTTTPKPSPTRIPARARTTVAIKKITKTTPVDPYLLHELASRNKVHKTHRVGGDANSLVTQSSWDPYAAHDPKNSKRNKSPATHSPWPSMYHDQYGQQNEHFFPAKSTYAPYVYGSSSSSQKKKKTLIPFSVLDKDLITNFAKDFVSYLAAPFYVPASISNAMSMPSGIESENIFQKIARSLRSAFLKRESNGSKRNSESNNQTPSSVKDNNIKQTTLLASVLKNRIVPILSLLSNSIKDGSMTLPKGGVTKVDRAKRVENVSLENILLSKFIDYLRSKSHRTPTLASPSV